MQKASDLKKLSLPLLFSLLLASSCGAGPNTNSNNNSNTNTNTSTGTCNKNNPDATKYVTVGFWKTSDCSGEPVNTNSFPIANDAPCYCWPGNSGKNSANKFSCNTANNSFTYSQYTNLTCATGGNGSVKTTFTDKCTQDIPPTIYSKIVDYSACKK